MKLRQIQLLAAQILEEIATGVRLDDALTQACAMVSLQDSQRGALVDMVYGCQRFSGSLKYYLRQLVTKPVPHSEVEALIVVALYQLAYTRNAKHAVVHEAVAAGSQLARGKFKALINAVLRRFLREQHKMTIPSHQIEARFNLPAWWLKRLKQDYPNDWYRIVSCAQLRPIMTLRVNQRRITRQDYLHLLQQNGIGARSMDVKGAALILDEAVSVGCLPGFYEGLVSVQDYGAQQAAQLLDVKDSERILDACAAPGGKTTHLLENADCALVALEIDEKRMVKVRENLTRLSLQAQQVIVADAADVSDWFQGMPLFDAVLADVPCTASGVIRRHPDIKWLRQPEDAARIAKQQIPLLDALWTTVRPKGRLLLATCSIFREENQQQTQAFLKRHADAHCRLEKHILPSEEQDGFYYALFDKV